eukprot:Em0158g11a
MAINNTVARVLQGFGPLFYLVPPSKSSFKSPNDVPNYVQEATPYFFVLIMLEAVIRVLQKKSLPRINDSISSLTAGMLMTFVPMLTGSIEVTMYALIYRHCRVVDLPWDSPWTWWCAFVCVDFVYYWFHRMAHEVNLFWAAHQVHHSSEEYNLTTALRQSTFQRFTSMVILNTHTQCWQTFKCSDLHISMCTVLQSSNGPVGPSFCICSPQGVQPSLSVLDTHRGVNPYCIDKNYGKPRLGCIEDIPQVSSATTKPYDKAVPRWLKLYCVVHFVLVLYGSNELGRTYKTMPFMVSIPLIAYFTFSLTCFGLMFDLNPSCVKAELLRLALFGVCDVFVTHFLPTAEAVAAALPPPPPAEAEAALPPPPPAEAAAELPPPPPAEAAAELPPPPPAEAAAELPPPPPPAAAAALPPPPPAEAAAAELPPPPPAEAAAELPPLPPAEAGAPAATTTSPHHRHQQY